jgi:hypothetical protein
LKGLGTIYVASCCHHQFGTPKPTLINGRRVGGLISTRGIVSKSPAHTR